MPTNAQLKTLVNTDIRSKTLPNSILKGKVADTIDAAYDYTDQEVGDLDTRVAEYFEDNIFGDYGSFTEETVSAPYPQLPFRVNYCLGAGSPSRISLPDAPLVGQQVYIITAFNQTLYAKSDGTGTFLSAATNSGSSSFSLLANKGYRFTYLGAHLGTPSWIVELLGV
jgi:hypothetical protein